MTTRTAAAAAHRPARRSALAAALLTLGLAFVLALVPGRAHAHDTLLDSSPADGTLLTDPPSEITLTYSGNVLPGSMVVELTDGDGTVVPVGDPSISGPVATVPTPDLTGGEYDLAWSVVSSDGHRIEGTLGFVTNPADVGENVPSSPTADAVAAADAEAASATQAPTTEAPTTEAPTSQTPAEEAEEESTPSQTWWIAIAAAVLIAALGIGAAFYTKRARNVAEDSSE